MKQTDQTWHDDGRHRDVPVRIYVDDATPAKPSPVILLSHGLGGSREAMAYAAEAWAAHGYVCVTLQHAGSDEAIWRDAPPAGRLEALKTGMTVQAYKGRCLDVRFAIDELTKLDAADGPLKDRLDLDHVGLAGHSFGAQTVQAIIGQRLGTPRRQPPSMADPRVKAAVAFSPAWQYGDETAKWAFANVTVPCLHFTGTQDVSPIGGATAAERRVPFDHVPPGEQYLVTIDGGDHMVFGGGPARRLSTADPAKYDAWHALIVDVTTHFWDAELRGDAEAKRWMRDDAKAAVGKAGTFEAKLAPATMPAK